MDTTEQILPELLKRKNQGDWQGFIDLTIAFPELYQYAFDYFDNVPDDLKREMAVGCYLHSGDNIGCVRNAIRKLKDLEPPTLPKRYAGKDVITVYRAGEEDITKCSYRISWTTSRKVAQFFLEEYIGKHATHLYKAKIKTNDILAYSNDRKEQEVMQYNKVFDITEIS